MLTSDQINELHRLYVSERWPIRKIERHLKLGWKTIKKYLETPAQGPATRERRSKLDPFKAMVAECLEKDPSVTAALIFQRIKDQGFSGGHAILQEYVRKVRPQPESKLRSGLGALRCSELLRRQSQALCVRAGGRAQPHALRRVHAQPELRNLRPLPCACVPCIAGSGARNRL